jgi:pimeloyl-ACP methyl ester carboxylesterase
LEPLLGLAAVVLLIPLAGALYQRWGKRRDALGFPAPGRLVDIGGCRLHIDSQGEGSPPVVFEAGIAATSLSWRLVQPAIAKYARSVSYDRAGLGWSDPSPQPRNLGQVIDELRTLLDRADVATPRILVAHSYGGLVAAAYAAKYPAEIAGLVLVDPVAAEEWREPTESHRKMLRRGVMLSRRGALLARLGVVRFALTLLTGGARRLPQFVARASSGRGHRVLERMVGQIQKLPPEVWPMIQSHWCDPKSFESMARYLESLPESAAAVARYGPVDMPVVVVSSAHASPAERAAHEILAARSSDGRVEPVAGSGHWIHLDRPDAVIGAIAEMIGKVRRDRRSCEDCSNG